MLFRPGRSVFSIGNHIRHAVHRVGHAIRNTVEAAVKAAPHVGKAIEDTRHVYNKLKPLLVDSGYGRHTNRIDTHLSTYDRVRRALE
jgi:hypothetical protein